MVEKIEIAKGWAEIGRFLSNNFHKSGVELCNLRADLGGSELLKVEVIHGMMRNPGGGLCEQRERIHFGRLRGMGERDGFLLVTLSIHALDDVLQREDVSTLCQSKTGYTNNGVGKEARHGHGYERASKDDTYPILMPLRKNVTLMFLDFK